MKNKEWLHTDFVALKTAFDIGACYSRIPIKKLCRCIIIISISLLQKYSHYEIQQSFSVCHNIVENLAPW
jgi:hypothetical protein